MLFRTLLALTAALAITLAPPAYASDDPRDQVIYLVMVDRFFNGDKANDHGADPGNPHAYHGGDLAGLRAKLPDLQDLGVTTLWLTPVNDNQNNALDGKYHGYHGYWIEDFDRVDEHLGSEADLRALVADAHKRGMRVILDVVVNHCGYDAQSAKDPAKASWFHHNGRIEDWEDPYQNENHDLAGLPDYASENKLVLAFMEKAWGGWVQRTGIDGFRLDTVRHVPVAFWHRFNGKMHALAKRPFFIVGEVSYHDPAKVAPYMRDAGLDSAFDFPMFGTLGEVFARGGSMRLLADRFAQDRLYTDPRMLSPFLDNHDEVRFLTAAKGDERKLRLALACLFGMRGIPSLTWGTEVGMTGGRDPDNRHDMIFQPASPLRAYTRGLIKLRRAQEALRRGTQRTLYVDEHVLAFAREAGAARALVVLNNGLRPLTRSIGLAGLPAGRWRDALDGSVASSQNGRLETRLAPYQARVYLPTR